MSRKQVTALVLESREYRERDAIVTMAVPDGILHVFARGVQPETSKNKRLCLPFTRVSVDLEEGKDGSLRLIHGTPEKNYSQIGTDLRKQAVCLAVNEAAVHSSMDPVIYARMERLWQACENDEKDWPGQAVLCMTALLQQEGIAPQVDGCAVCGEMTGIDCMDMEAAGFLCEKHSRGRTRWEPARLRRFRHAVKVPGGCEDRIDLSGFTTEDVLFLAQWFARYAHSSLNAARFLETVTELYRS